MLKVIVVRAHKEQRKTGEEASIFREHVNNHQHNVGGNLVIKGHSVRSQAEMRNMLLETRGKVILFIVIKNIVHMCSSVLWKIDIVSNKIGYLDEEISKQNV